MLNKSTRIRLGQLQKSERKLVFNKVKVYSVDSLFLISFMLRKRRRSREGDGERKKTETASIGCSPLGKSENFRSVPLLRGPSFFPPER